MYAYTGSVSEHVGWIRRELLLKKASSGDISRVLPVLSELQSDDLQRITEWLPGPTAADGKFLFKFPAFRYSPSTQLVTFTFPATTINGLYLAHWPDAVRKMAVHVKGLVEGVLRKKMERRDSAGRVEMHAQAADSDLFS